MCWYWSTFFFFKRESTVFFVEKPRLHIYFTLHYSTECWFKCSHHQGNSLSYLLDTSAPIVKFLLQLCFKYCWLNWKKAVCGMWTSAQMPHKWAHMAVQAADVLLFKTPHLFQKGNQFSCNRCCFNLLRCQLKFLVLKCGPIEFGFSSPTRTSHDWATLPMSHNFAVFRCCIAWFSRGLGTSFRYLAYSSFQHVTPPLSNPVGVFIR